MLLPLVPSLYISSFRPLFILNINHLIWFMSTSISSTTAVTAKDTAVRTMQQKHLVGGQLIR